MLFNSKFDTRAVRYLVAIALAVAAQIARTVLSPPTLVPFITYAPFMVVSAIVGGLGPGLVCTILCTLESIYFAVDPIGSFWIGNPANWHGIGALAVTGLIASALSDRLKRGVKRLAEAHRKTSAILEGLSDGFHAFDREGRCTCVNRAATKMFGKPSGEVLGKTFDDLWPQSGESSFALDYRRAIANNAPLRVEAFFHETLNSWMEVRCYPSLEGVSLFFSDVSERRSNEERLRLLESAIVQASDGILIVKVSGGEPCQPTPVFMNPSLQRMTGFSLEDLRQGGLRFLDVPCLQCPTYGEQAMYRKDGSHFWVECNFRPLGDVNGKYTHCVWNCRDMTDRRQAEETSRLLSSIVESSDDAIISKNMDGIVLSWNQGAQRIYGYTAAEMLGQPISLLLPPEHPDQFPETMEYLKLGKKIEHLETERVKKDGQRISVSLSISPMKDSSNQIVGAAVIARDISRHKQAEAAIGLSEERYRALVLVSSQIVWTTNPAGEVEDMPVWRAFTGQSVDEVRAWGWIEALHPEDRSRTVEVWSRSVRNHSFYDTEYRMRRHDGEYRWMAVHGVPILEKGIIREWVGTCADITERKQAEEEIRKLNQDLEQRVAERTALWEASNKELEAFTYSVSHDLRAPLRAIDGFSRILLEEFALPLPEQAHHYLDVVRTNAVQMGNLIDDLLAFSRLSRQPLRKQTVDVAEVVRQALEQLAAEREGREVEFMIGQLPCCEGDPALLKQVFVNLFSNALKYTKPRHPAWIAVGSLVEGEAEFIPADVPVYYVRDNGVGFDMRYVEKLFGVFQRLHNAEEFAGTGVGLALVHRIISRHGGRIWANAAVDRGATFYFTLAGSDVAQEQHGKLSTVNA